MSDQAHIYSAEQAVAETLAIEQRLRDGGYAALPEVLRLGGDFDYHGETVEDILDEVRRYLQHQHSVELSGATILAAIGEAAVKAQALDAIADLVRRRPSA
ncbi:MAG TPA: hypothetical protein VFW63_02350 [Acidimicrobiales bacterium]|nr:hypothetical protein [Acidimicrobiales bacterium]